MPPLYEKGTHLCIRYATTVIGVNWCRMRSSECQAHDQGRKSLGCIDEIRASNELFKMLIIKLELVIKTKKRDNWETGAYAQEGVMPGIGPKSSSKWEQRIREILLLWNLFLSPRLKNIIKESWTPAGEIMNEMEWLSRRKRMGVKSSMQDTNIYWKRERQTLRKEWSGNIEICTVDVREQQRQRKRNIETEMENNAVSVCARTTEMERRDTEIKQQTESQIKNYIRSRCETKSHKSDWRQGRDGEKKCYMSLVGSEAELLLILPAIIIILHLIQGGVFPLCSLVNKCCAAVHSTSPSVPAKISISLLHIRSTEGHCVLWDV